MEGFDNMDPNTFIVYDVFLADVMWHDSMTAIKLNGVQVSAY